MNTLQKVLTITQITVSVMFFITLGINYLQLRTMFDQLETVRRSTAAQHILNLVSFMESDEVRAAQMVVYTTLQRKHFNSWTYGERQAASKLCASFATAGAILRSDLVPVRPLLEGWEPTLRRCYEVLQPFIREMQKPENNGPQYWTGFDWLYNQLDVKAPVNLTTSRYLGGRRHALQSYFRTTDGGS